MTAVRAITRVQDADDVASTSGNDGKWLRLSSGAFVFATPTASDVGAIATGAVAGGDLNGTFPNPGLGTKRWALGGKTYVSGRYYAGRFTTTGGGALQTEALMQAIPFLVKGDFTADRISVFQTVAGSAGAVVRLGIYSDTGSLLPGALLLDAGTYDASSGTSVTKEIAISQALTTGIYWLVAVAQGTPTTRATLLSSSAGPAIDYLSHTAVFGNANGFSQASVSGALPGTFTPTLVQGTAIPMVWLRSA